MSCAASAFFPMTEPSDAFGCAQPSPTPGCGCGRRSHSQPHHSQSAIKQKVVHGVPTRLVENFKGMGRELRVRPGTKTETEMLQNGKRNSAINRRTKRLSVKLLRTP